MAIDYELLNSSGKVNTFDYEAFLQNLADRLLDIALKLAYGLVILIIGLIILAILLFILRRIINRTKWDETLKKWLINVVSVLLKVILATIVIGSVGIEVVSFTALISAMGMALGLALSGIVQNFMAGVLIIVLKPIKVGEWIGNSGVEGVVDEIGIVFTKLVAFNRQAHFIPNSLIVNGVVTNYTRRPKRRFDLTFTISFREDIDRARDAVLAEILSDERVLHNPRPVVTVEDMDAAKIKLNVLPWIDTPEDTFTFLGIKCAMYRHILDGIQKSELAVGPGVYDVVYHFGPQPLPAKPQEKTVHELEEALELSDHDSDKEEDDKKEVPKRDSRTNLLHKKDKHKKLDDEEDSEEEKEEKKEEKKKHGKSKSKSKKEKKEEGVEMEQV